MSFDIRQEGRPAAQGGTQTDQLAALLEVTRDMPDVVFVSADATRSFRLSRQLCDMPGKVIEVGVAEASAIGIGYGLALKNFRPFVLGFSTFLLLRGLEMIRSLVCYHDASVTLLGGMSGLSNSRDGFMHQSTDDVGILSGIGKIRIMTPSDASSLSATATEMWNARGPKFIRLYRTVIDLGDNASPLTTWSPVATRLDFGNDFAIVSYGAVLAECAASVNALRAEGKRGKLIEMLQLQPFDKGALLSALGGVKLAVSVEDHLIQSGLGSRLRATVKECRGSECKVVNLGLQDGQYGSSGHLHDLFASYHLDAQSIKQTVLSELS